MQGNIYVYQYIIKGRIKATNEQPNEGIHRVRSGRVPSSWSWGTPPSKHVDVFTNLDSPNPILWGFLWRFYHVGMINFSISSPSHLSGDCQGVAASLVPSQTITLIKLPFPEPRLDTK